MEARRFVVMDAPGELLTTWLKSKGFTRDHLLYVWEYKLPAGQSPIRITDESLSVISLDIVPTVKQEIERTLAAAGVGR